MSMRIGGNCYDRNGGGCDWNRCTCTDLYISWLVDLKKGKNHPAS